MSSSIVVYLLPVVYSVALPLGLLIWWKRKTGVRLWCFIAGAICFTLFAMLLEQIFHTVLLLGDNAFSNAVKGSAIAYTLYASLSAGLFEETGRLFGYKIFLKNHREKECAVAYGIGHGGMEVCLILGMTYLIYLLAKCGIPIGDAQTTASIINTADSIPIGTVCIAMFERLSAMLTHLGLSMAVFPAARQKGRLWLYPAAILMHAFADAPAALYQYGIITSIRLIEGAAFITGLVYLIAGIKLLGTYE